MGVLYGKYDLLDSLTAYKVRPASNDPPDKFETGTGDFEGMCGVLGALEYIEWVGEAFGAEQAERYTADYSGRRLYLKQGMAAIRAYEFELSRACWIFSKRRRALPSMASPTAGGWRSACPPVPLHWRENIPARWRKN
jgi:selenocysteine lyase/cysteine desulfurase